MYPVSDSQYIFFNLNLSFAKSLYENESFRGQLILKCLFVVFVVSQKKDEKNSTWGTIVVKLILFVIWENWRYQKEILKLTDL